MTFDFKVDTSKFARMLADVPAAIERAKQQALRAIGAEVKSQAELTFRHPQYRPSPWVPRKNNADPERPLLQKSGVMKRDLDSRIKGNDTVLIFTPHEYIKYHQTGTKNMPARPVFPVKDGNLTPRVERKVRGIVDKAFSDALPQGSIPRPIWPGGN